MKVLITGGSGWLGRAIQRYWDDNEYVVYSRSESAQAKCQERFPHADYVLGDIRDTARLELAVRGYGVEAIIHTAGMKRVQDCEKNAWEAVEVNVDGSRNVAKVASRCGVDVCVAISTDKAIGPSGVYGMTKALMESLWQEYARLHSGAGPRFVIVRNGNFIGSTGSVIELWQRQLAECKKITLTDPHMTRFWQSASDTVRLIREAVELGSTGQAYCPLVMPPMGAVSARAMSMGDLAALMIEHCGGQVQVVGARPGDKLHERLEEGGFTSGEALTISKEEMWEHIQEAATI